MKKVFIMFLTLGLVMCLASCGNQKSTENGDNSSTSEVSANTPATTSTNDNTTAELLNSYKVPGKNIVVDVPNYQEIEKGFSQIYILHGEQYVAVTADKNTSVATLAEAHEVAFNKFKENIQNYSYVNSIKVNEGENKNINGIETYRYEGTLNCGRDTVYDAYVVGYSFIMDGTPCTITGSVINQEQSQDQIDEVHTLIETMIESLRSER